MTSTPWRRYGCQLRNVRLLDSKCVGMLSESKTIEVWLISWAWSNFMDPWQVFLRENSFSLISGLTNSEFLLNLLCETGPWCVHIFFFFIFVFVCRGEDYNFLASHLHHFKNGICSTPPASRLKLETNTDWKQWRRLIEHPHIYSIRFHVLSCQC